MTMQVDSKAKNGEYLVCTKKITSAELFDITARAMIIEHNGQEYLLRVTQKNKLILTK